MLSNVEKAQPANIMVYGAPWCENSIHVRRLLDLWDVAYRYIDISRETHAQNKLATWTLGMIATPVVTCGPREDPRLMAPTDAELFQMLHQNAVVRSWPLLR